MQKNSLSKNNRCLKIFLMLCIIFCTKSLFSCQHDSVVCKPDNNGQTCFTISNNTSQEITWSVVATQDGTFLQGPASGALTPGTGTGDIYLCGAAGSGNSLHATIVAGTETFTVDHGGTESFLASNYPSSLKKASVDISKEHGGYTFYYHFRAFGNGQDSNEITNAAIGDCYDDNDDCQTEVAFAVD